MKSVWNLITTVLNAILTVVMVIVFGVVAIIVIAILACLCIIVFVCSLIYWIAGGDLPDICKKKELDKD